MKFLALLVVAVCIAQVGAGQTTVGNYELTDANSHVCFHRKCGSSPAHIITFYWNSTDSVNPVITVTGAAWPDTGLTLLNEAGEILKVGKDSITITGDDMIDDEYYKLMVQSCQDGAPLGTPYPMYGTYTLKSTYANRYVVVGTEDANDRNRGVVADQMCGFNGQWVSQDVYQSVTLTGATVQPKTATGRRWDFEYCLARHPGFVHEDGFCSSTAVTTGGDRTITLSVVFNRIIDLAAIVINGACKHDDDEHTGHKMKIFAFPTAAGGTTSTAALAYAEWDLSKCGYILDARRMEIGAGIEHHAQPVERVDFELFCPDAGASDGGADDPCRFHLSTIQFVEAPNDTDNQAYRPISPGLLDGDRGSVGATHPDGLYPAENGFYPYDGVFRTVPLASGTVTQWSTRFNDSINLVAVEVWLPVTFDTAGTSCTLRGYSGATVHALDSLGNKLFQLTEAPTSDVWTSTGLVKKYVVEAESVTVANIASGILIERVIPNDCAGTGTTPIAPTLCTNNCVLEFEQAQIYVSPETTVFVVLNGQNTIEFTLPFEPILGSAVRAHFEVVGGGATISPTEHVFSHLDENTTREERVGPITLTLTIAAGHKFDVQAVINIQVTFTHEAGIVDPRFLGLVINIVALGFQESSFTAAALAALPPISGTGPQSNATAITVEVITQREILDHDNLVVLHLDPSTADEFDGSTAAGIVYAALGSTFGLILLVAIITSIVCKRKAAAP